jgi:hypothetical protein
MDCGASQTVAGPAFLQSQTTATVTDRCDDPGEDCLANNPGAQAFCGGDGRLPFVHRFFSFV